jgi:hypothetical protein
MLTNYLRSGVAASTYTPLTRSISTTSPLQGGGDLSANRTFSITQASGSVNGFLSSTDWTTFNGKGNGTVTSVSGSGAISVNTGTTTPVISIADATALTSGVMTATDQQFQGEKKFFGSVWFIDFARFNLTNYTATRIAGLSSTNRLSDVTLGSGLSLSGGVLSATSGGVSSVTASTPLSSSGGTTPNITIANASSSASGVVTTTTQSFAGAKTFTNLVGFQRSIQRPVESVTVSSASITTSSTWVVVNNAGTVTLTFPSASSSTGTEFYIKTITNNAVVSQSNNVVPLAGGSASTPILSATAGKWATLVSDGTNWIIMQAN